MAYGMYTAYFSIEDIILFVFKAAFTSNYNSTFEMLACA